MEAAIMSVPTKLTLRLDARLIERAKAYASGQDRSLSQLVADYFSHLAPAAAAGAARKPATGRKPSGPITAGLRGALRSAGGGKGAKASSTGRDDYRAHLEQKYL
jgi:hypothetical protein